MRKKENKIGIILIYTLLAIVAIGLSIAAGTFIGQKIENTTTGIWIGLVIGIMLTLWIIGIMSKKLKK